MHQFFHCDALQGATEDPCSGFEHLLQTDIFSFEESNTQYISHDKPNRKLCHKRQASNGSDHQGNSQEEIQGQFPFFSTCPTQSAITASPTSILFKSPKRQRLSESGTSPKRRTLSFSKPEGLFINASPLKKHDAEECLTPLTPSFDLSPDFPTSLSDDIFETPTCLQQTILPTISASQCRHPDCNTISPETMREVIEGKYKEKYTQLFIIDCRFPFEHNGGHIRGALNCYDPSAVFELLFSDSIKNCENCIIIFHCEFSQQRAPKMYRFVRQQDRNKHAKCYPKLSYPNIYLLEGGYKAFYEHNLASNVQLCEPFGYTAMHSESHHAELKLIWSNYLTTWKKRKEICKLENQKNSTK